MNWVSYAEDIEELRQENEHFQRGMDALIARLRKGVSPQEIHRIEDNYRNLADQIIGRYTEIKTSSQKQLEHAIRYLQDPAVQITSKLKKVTQEREDARVELHKCKSELRLCRDSQTRNLAKINELHGRLKVLEQELGRVKDISEWKTEIASIEPLRKK